MYLKDFPPNSNVPLDDPFRDMTKLGSASSEPIDAKACYDVSLNITPSFIFVTYERVGIVRKV